MFASGTKVRIVPPAKAIRAYPRFYERFNGKTGEYVKDIEPSPDRSAYPETFSIVNVDGAGWVHVDRKWLQAA